MIFGIPPGRTGRLWLRRRVDVAERAVDLLDRQLRLLNTEQDRLRLLVQNTRADWEARCAEADQWLLRATLLGGRRALRLASDDLLAKVTVEYTTTMGVRYPMRVDYHPADPRIQMPQGIALIQARQACRAALAAAGRNAAASAAARTLDQQMAAIRRRKHAIKDRRLPQLRTALKNLEFTLEEQEREDTARLRLRSRK